MAQLIRITSEALQAQIRRLLPSQQGFGEDLEASNIITPIIDLTPTAEGSEVRADLQRAYAFGSETTFDVTNTSTSLVSTAGFYAVRGIACIKFNSGNTQTARLQLSDGTIAVKNIWMLRYQAEAGTVYQYEPFDITVFLRPGDGLLGIADVDCRITGSLRQIADVNGELTNPVGFAPQ